MADFQGLQPVSGSPLVCPGRRPTAARMATRTRRRCTATALLIENNKRAPPTFALSPPARDDRARQTDGLHRTNRHRATDLG